MKLLLENWRKYLTEQAGVDTDGDGYPDGTVAPTTAAAPMTQQQYDEQARAHQLSAISIYQDSYRVGQNEQEHGAGTLSWLDYIQTDLLPGTSIEPTRENALAYYTEHITPQINSVLDPSKILTHTPVGDDGENFTVHASGYKGGHYYDDLASDTDTGIRMDFTKTDSGRMEDIVGHEYGHALGFGINPYAGIDPSTTGISVNWIRRHASEDHDPHGANFGDHRDRYQPLSTSSLMNAAADLGLDPNEPIDWSTYDNGSGLEMIQGRLDNIGSQTMDQIHTKRMEAAFGSDMSHHDDDDHHERHWEPYAGLIWSRAQKSRHYDDRTVGVDNDGDGLIDAEDPDDTMPMDSDQPGNYPYLEYNPDTGEHGETRRHTTHDAAQWRDPYQTGIGYPGGNAEDMEQEWWSDDLGWNTPYHGFQSSDVGKAASEHGPSYEDVSDEEYIKNINTIADLGDEEEDEWIPKINPESIWDSVTAEQKMFNNWRKFLTEAQQAPHQIYCDMDGVLVDFVRGALMQINKDIKDVSLPSQLDDGKKLTSLGLLRFALKQEDLEQIDEEHIEKEADGPAKVRKAAINYMYRRLAEDEDFWANLPWMPGGKQLWNIIKKYEPHILTAPMGKGSERGKERWIQKNLHPKPSNIYMSHDKFNWAMEDGQRNVLIDDFMINIKPWRDAGGIAVHHKYDELQSTLEKLQQAGFNVLRAENEHTDEDMPNEPEED